MVTLKYPPIVILNGRTLPDGWNEADLSALTGLTFTWGRTELLTEVPPISARLQVVDQDGTLTGDAKLFRSLLEVSTAFGKLFSGRVDSVSYRPVKWFDRGLQQNRAAWQVTVAAQDKGAELRRQYIQPPPVPASYLPEVKEWIQLASAMPAWFVDNGQNNTFNWRLDHVMNAGAKSIVSGIDYPAWGANTVNDRPGDDLVTSWQITSETYTIDELAYPYYDPASNRVRVTGPGDELTTTLKYSGGTIAMAVGTAIDRTLPAALLEMTGDGTIHSALPDSISHVTLNGFLRIYSRQTLASGRSYGYSAPTRRESVTASVDIATQTEARSQLVIDTPLSVNADQDGYPLWAGGMTQSMQERIIDALKKLRGKVAPPPVVFDVQRDGDKVSATVLAQIMRCTPGKVSLFLSGSQYARLSPVASVVNIIGGTLTFDQGWRHELTFAPTRGGGRGALTWGQVVTNRTPTAAQFDRTITIGDLALATQGAS